MPDHVCPFGKKSKALPERQGYAVADHHLKRRQETDDFLQQHGVDTTPQTFIAGKRIGGYDDMRAYFEVDQTPEKMTRTIHRQSPPCGSQGLSKLHSSYNLTRHSHR